MVHGHRPESDGSVLAAGDVAALGVVVRLGHHVATDYIRNDHDTNDGVAMLRLDEADDPRKRHHFHGRHEVPLSAL